MFKVTLCSQFTWIYYTLIAFSITCFAAAFAPETHPPLHNHNTTKREADDLKIVCYYSNWAANSHASAAQTPENITPYLCTHLNRRTRSLETLESLAVTRRPSSRRRFPAATPSPAPIVTDPPIIIDPVTTEPEASDAEAPFECEDEGFFKNPKDCRKYFWCLDSGPANLGVVAHAFTCPSGLYFNTKTEACDYPQNVNCKQKGKLEVTTKKPRTRIRLTNPPTTTTTTTTTPTTTTEIPSTSAPQPQITPELIAEALKLANAQSPPQNTQNNELTQLLQLVQSLGGIDKVQNLLSNKVKPTQSHPNFIQDNDAVLEGVANTRTTQSFFTPSYETPNRHEFTPPAVTTETSTPTQQSSPASGNWLGLSRNQVRSRRPQYDYNLVTTPNPFLGHPKEEKPLNVREHNPQPPQSPFNFVYINPERTAAPKNNVPPQPLPAEAPTLESGAVDGFFVYNTPGRYSLPSTRSTTFATESPPEVPKLAPYPQQPPSDRLTLRVSPGNSFRLPIESGRGNRRPMRVQVQSAFTVDDRTVPGVLYDEEAEIATHKPASNPELRESSQSPHSSPQVIARRPGRRRPPQRPHLRDNKKENAPPPIANLLPPNILHEPQNQPEKELRNSFPEIRNNEYLLPTPSPNAYHRAQTPRSTPTTPPPIHDIFDYSPTQAPRQSFPLISSSAKVTTEALTTPRPLVRRGRPRRPSPQPTQSFQVTTPRRPTTEVPVTTAPIESSNTASEFSGPTVIIEKSGQINCGRRGVHPHPNSCAQFVVCAPGKNGNTLRSYTHHCPAEQVFVKEVGRCRPGNRALC